MERSEFCRQIKLGQSCYGCPNLEEVRRRAVGRPMDITLVDVAQTVQRDLCPAGGKIQIVANGAGVSSFRNAGR